MRKLFTLRTVLMVLLSIPFMNRYASAAVGDAGVESILSPTNTVCRGIQPVTVVIRNFGGITISTVTVNWQVNGVSQTSFNYNGTIIAGGTDTVTLGSSNFSQASTSLVAWTSNPNGSADSDQSNDSSNVAITLSAQLSGTYTIGGATPDYPTFNAAVAALVTNGVCGPVTFNMRAGTDTMQSIITQIPGADSTNTITFQSENGDSTSAVLTYPSAPAVTPTNYLIRLDGADYLTFKNLTLQRTGIEPYGRVLEITNQATHNTITHCRIIGSTTNSTNSLATLIYSGSGSPTNDSMNTFSNNRLVNGTLGIYMNGVAALNFETGTVVSNNIFENQTSKGVQMTNQGFAVVEGNTFATGSTYVGYVSIYLDRSQRSQRVVKNRITTVPGTGIYLVDCTALINIHAIIANNFVHCSDSAGISVVNCDNQDIVFNSVLMTGTNSTFAALSIHGAGSGRFVKNNLLVNSGGGYAYEIGPNPPTSSDYNNLFSTGAFIGTYNGTNVANIANWKTVTQSDTNSISVNPNFASSTDLHVTSIAMDDRGTPLANVSDDIDGQVRSNLTPDIGADEYASVSRNVGVTGIANPLNNGCGDDSTYFGIIVSNPGGFTESNFNVVTYIVGPTSDTLTQMFSGNLPAGTTDTLVYSVPFNSAGGGTYQVKSFTSLGVDDVHANDTLTTTLTLTLPPSAPAVTSSSICGPGSDTINVVSSDTIRFYTASTGGTLLSTGNQFITPLLNATTTYYVAAMAGCESIRTPVTITVLPVPSVNLGNDTSINQGGSVTLNAGAGFSSYMWSPGNQTTSSISVTAAGCYSVTVTNASGCADSDTICVDVILPNDVGISAIISPSDNNCADDSVQVLVSVSNLGSNSVSNVPVTLTISGSLTASFTDTITAAIPAGANVVLNLGMINTTGGDTITVTAYTSYTNDPDHSNDTIIEQDTINIPLANAVGIGGLRCGPGAVSLNATGSDSIYWYDAPTGGNLLFTGSPFIVAGLDSTTTFYVQNGNVCNTQPRVGVTATINQLPVVNLGNDTVVNTNGIVLDAGAGFASYDWSTGATTQTITAMATGNYSVCVVDNNGCNNCDTVSVSISVGIADASLTNISVYPNPAHESVSISFGSSFNGTTVLAITNINGQLVFEDILKNVSNGKIEVINLGGFAKGIYNLQIKSTENASNYKLVIE